MPGKKTIFHRFVLICFGVCCFLPSYSQKSKKKDRMDTVYVRTGQYVILPDTDFLAISDTFLIANGRKKVKIKENPYAKSEAFYDSLKSRSYQNKVSRELYGLLFRNKATTVSDSTNVIKSARVFRPFEGNRINRIIFVNVDILEGSVYDTTLVAETGLGRFLNRTHITTKDQVIIHNLLFDIGDLVDPYILADNERILRVLPFIDDALIEIIPDLNNEDQVDVIVITQDLMAWGIDGSISSLSDWRLALYNQNFLGRGSELYMGYQHRGDQTPQDGYLVRLRQPNLWGSFIRGEIKYQNDFKENSVIVDLRRDFVTPEIKYAGGLIFGDQQGYVDGRVANDTLNKQEAQVEFRKGFYDFWIGRSFQVNRKNERQNFVISARVLNEDYSDRPPTDENMNLKFQDKLAVFGNLAYTQRNFLKSNYIFNFGRTEDIPVGYAFTLDYGYEFGEFVNRPYLGGRNGIRWLLQLARIYCGKSGLWRILPSGWNGTKSIKIDRPVFYTSYKNRQNPFASVPHFQLHQWV